MADERDWRRLAIQETLLEHEMTYQQVILFQAFMDFFDQLENQDSVWDARVRTTLAELVIELRPAAPE